MIPGDIKGNVNVTSYFICIRTLFIPVVLNSGRMDTFMLQLPALVETTSTEGSCEQVIPPVGPYLGGNTASIVKISP